MKVITLNANGIRAAARKGFFPWVKQQDADVICIQETKAQLQGMDLQELVIPNYHMYFSDAQKKGYSGVAIYCKQKPDQVLTGLGFACADDEGRYVQADFGNLSVVSLYLPSGSSGEERQAMKFSFMECYLPILRQQINSGREFVICGDWNIVHKEIDIKNFKSNQKNSGCLPEERAWIDNLFTQVGLVDAFRVVNQEAEQYTWWSQRGQARAKNVGWRIDYQIVTPKLKEKVRSAFIYKEQNFSDHAPLIVEYDCEV